MRAFQILAACAGLAFAGSTFAANPQPEITASEGYQIAHPDLRWRAAGEEAMRQGNTRQALDHFRRAASYGDKPSQAALATMLWNGDGQAPDRAAAYAWMDLAAERGYPDLILERERYWSALSEAERQRALDVGESIWAEYGDEVAKPRQERMLARYRIRTTTGSQMGRGGASEVQIYDHSSGRTSTVHGLIYHDPRFWDTAHHWAVQDAEWRARPAARAAARTVRVEG